MEMAGTGRDGRSGEDGSLFDHERLEVYRVARDYFVLATALATQKMPRDLKEQFDSASTSILFNIGEGAGKMARPDKQRFYEIARGSTLECATQLEVMHIRQLVTTAQYQQARTLLLRVAKMLSRLSRGPRPSRESP
jgi:four helix bundle protein